MWFLLIVVLVDLLRPDFTKMHTKLLKNSQSLAARVTMIGWDPSLGNSNGGLAFHPNGTLYFTPCWVDD